jgi:Ca-activated chloride channel family protein
MEDKMHPACPDGEIHRDLQLSWGRTMLSNRRSLVRSLLIAVVLISCATIHAARAQSEASQVHIEPPVQPRPEPGVLDSLNTPTTVIRKNVDLVLVPVTVTDKSNRLITGLDRQNFQVFDGKEVQQLRHFSSEDAPVSIGVLLDISASMNSKIEWAREAVMDLLKASNRQDEFFLIAFADVPQLLKDFSQNLDEVQNNLMFIAPKGQTSLLDAIFLGINNVKKAKYQRKALVIISDGDDNHSRYTETDIKSLVKEADVLVYSIGIFDADFRSSEERRGPALLSEISTITGASSYTLENPNDLPRISSRIAQELRSQYVLGYHPEVLKRDGRYHKITVKLIRPRGISALRVKARTGYYAASE